METDRPATWREGVEYWRAWAREGSTLDPEDAKRIGDFYDRLVLHGDDLDDEMPPDLVEQLKISK